MGMHLKNANDRLSTKVNTRNAYLPTAGSWDFSVTSIRQYTSGVSTHDELDQITRSALDASSSAGWLVFDAGAARKMGHRALQAPH